MPWLLKNVSLDPTHAMKRRTAKAARMEMEPTIAGTRIRLRQALTIPDEDYERNKDRIDLCVAQGVLTATQMGGSPAPKKEEAPPPPPPPEPEPEPEPEMASAELAVSRSDGMDEIPTPAPEPEVPTVEDTSKSHKGKKSKRSKK